MYGVCPLKLVTPLSLELFRLHAHYLHGHLPDSGGLMDQTGLYYDAMTYLESISHDRSS